LDGSLLLTDVLYESAVIVLRNKPFTLLKLLLQIPRGKAWLKHYIAENAGLTPATLPYNMDLLNWLEEERARGRRLILCTASTKKYAEEIAAFLGIFDEVMYSDEHSNLGGTKKAHALCERFGVHGFDYVGNSSADLPIWECAAEAILVNSNGRVTRKAKKLGKVVRILPCPQPGLAAWAATLRIQQWLKNFLLFAPLLAAHRFTEPGAVYVLIVAFLAFSLSASAMYVVNDLLDLESDRLHPRKRDRPLAAGLIPIPLGLIVSPLLLTVGIVLASQTNTDFLLCLVCYLSLNCCYSWFLKRFMLLDCVTLAVLYTLRIIAGAAAVDMSLSFWLLAFSVFLFLSLAFVKRYAEVEVQLLEGREKLHGRGYLTSDASILQNLGITAGYASALVLSLYLNSEQVLLLYTTPEFVWGAVLILLYWISWMWMQAHRGHMHDDPLVFAIKDRTSLLAGALFLLVLFLGTVKW
jgi:4-hydroxybenzoate polyprenyltransferase